MERAAQINAFVKAINNAADDDDKLLEVAAKLTQTPWLASRWRFRMVSTPGYPARLVAETRAIPIPPGVEEFITDIVAMATADPAKQQQALTAFAPIAQYCHLCEAEEAAHG